MTEALNFLGIDNFFSDKKERLITAEAEGSEALTNFYLNCFYKTRQEACRTLYRVARDAEIVEEHNTLQTSNQRESLFKKAPVDV